MKQIKILTLVFAFAGTFLHHAAAQDMRKQEATIRAAYDALNNKDWAKFASYCTPDFVDKNVGPAPVQGIQACIDAYKQFFAGFPDFKVTINEIAMSSPNRYLLRVTVTGTNTSTFMGIPATDKAIRFNDADVVELNAAGKCISHEITNVGEALREIGYGSMMNPSTGVVMAAYQDFGNKDLPALLAKCSDDVTFEIQDRMFDSKPRWFKGKAEVGEFFKELSSKFQYSKFQPVRFIADGDDVIILVEVEYKLLATGKTYTNTYTHHFVVKNGMVTYFRGVDDFPMEK